MPFWNPKQQSPFLAEYGQALMSQSMQQPTGRWSAIGNALRSVLGGAIMGGQARAGQREKEERMARRKGLAGILTQGQQGAPGAYGVQMQKPSTLTQQLMTPPGSDPGFGAEGPTMPPDIAGVAGMGAAPSAEDPNAVGLLQGAAGGPGGLLGGLGMTPDAASPAELQDERQDAFITALLESPDEEDQAAGMDLAWKKLNKSARGEIQVVEGKVLEIMPDGSVRQLFDASGNELDFHNFKPEDGVLAYDQQGNVNVIQEPTVQPEEPRVAHDKMTVVGDDGRLYEVPVVKVEDPPGSGHFRMEEVANAPWSIGGEQTFEGEVLTDSKVTRDTMTMLNNAEREETKIRDLLDNMTSDLFGMEGKVKRGLSLAADWAGVLELLPAGPEAATMDYIERSEKMVPNMRRALNDYIRQVTGAVMNETEIYRIVGSYVHEGLGFNTAMARAKALLDIVQRDKGLLAAQLARGRSKAEKRQILAEYLSREDYGVQYNSATDEFEEFGDAGGGGEEEDEGIY